MRIISILPVTTSVLWIGISLHHATPLPTNYAPLHREATVSFAVPSNTSKIAEEPSLTLFGRSYDTNGPHIEGGNLFHHSPTSIETHRETPEPLHLNATVGFNAINAAAPDYSLGSISTSFHDQNTSKSSKQSKWKKNRFTEGHGFGTDPIVINDSLADFSSVPPVPVHELNLGYTTPKSSNRRVPSYSPIVGCKAVCQVETDCTQLGYSHCVDNCCRKIRINSSKPTSNQVCTAVKTRFRRTYIAIRLIQIGYR